MANAMTTASEPVMATETEIEMQVEMQVEMEMEMEMETETAESADPAQGTART